MTCYLQTSGQRCPKRIRGQSVRTERILRRWGKGVVRWRYMHVGAPENRIKRFPMELVLTPRDEDMNPILGLGSHHLTKCSFITSWSRSATHFLKFFQISNLAVGKKRIVWQGPINENWSWRKYESLAVCLANGTASNLTPHILGPLSWFNLSYHIVPVYLGWSGSSIKNITHSTTSLYRNRYGIHSDTARISLNRHYAYIHFPISVPVLIRILLHSSTPILLFYYIYPAITFNHK